MLASIPVGVSTILMMVFAYRCIPHWKIALGLTGAAMMITGLAAATVILYWFLTRKLKRHSKE